MLQAAAQNPEDQHRGINLAYLAGLEGNSAAPVMGLPTISPEIPVFFDSPDMVKKAAPLLIALIERGYITEEEAAGNASKDGLVGIAMERWMKERSAGLEHLLPFVCFTDDMGAYGYCPEYVGEFLEATGEVKREGYGAFTLEYLKKDVIAVGRQLERLEKVVPGLGRSIIASLTKNLDTVSWAFVPEVAYEQAIFEHWGECESLDEALAEEIIDPEEEAAFRDMDPTAHMPEWAYRDLAEEDLETLERKVAAIPGDNIDCAAATRFLGLLKDIRIAADLPAPYSMHSIENDCGMIQLGASVVVRWGEQDNLLRLYDDHLHFAETNGGGNHLNRFYIFNNSREDVCHNLDNLDKLMTMIRALDAMLSELGAWSIH